jgi:hypothetical protein
VAAAETAATCTGLEERETANLDSRRAGLTAF